jgi:hypothetical protein
LARYGFFDEPEPAALVADVAMGSGTILEEAIGRVFEIYVAIPTNVIPAKAGIYKWVVWIPTYAGMTAFRYSRLLSVAIG